MNKHGDILLNPIRMRIIQLMANNKEVTIAHISKQMRDVPRTTVYRHMNVLLEHGYVTVCREVKIRGTYEREYSLNLNMLQTTSPEDTEENTNAFLIKLMADFNHYFKGTGDAVKDRLFLSANTLLLSDEEYESFLEELFAVVQQYMRFPAENGRKTRTLSIISSPSKQEEDSNVE